MPYKRRLFGRGVRRALYVLAALLVLGGGGAVGWRAWQHFFHDPLQAARRLMAKGDARGARLELLSAIQSDPGSAEAHERLGTVQIALGDLVAAEKELKTAQATGYKGTDLVPTLALSIVLQGRAREVLANFAPGNLPPTDEANIAVVRGLAQLALHDVPAAGASAEIAEGLAPQLAEGPQLAARVALAQGQPGAALAALDRALAINPKLGNALLLKAAILRRSGQPEAGLAVLDTAVAATPNAVRMRVIRAGALLADNEDVRARADVDFALERQPKNPLALYLKTILLIRAKDWAGADGAMQGIQPRLPRLPRGEYYYALVKSNLPQLEQASEAAQHYVARNRFDADGWRLLARIDLLAGRRDDAAAALAKLPSGLDEKLSVTAALPGEADEAATPQELTRTAAAQLDAGDIEAAEQDLERSVESVPSASDIESGKVVAALRSGDIDRATAALARLEALPKTRPELLGTLTGAVRMAQLDIKGAQQAWEQALRLVPDSVALRVNLARVQALRGQPEAALKLLEPVLAGQPANVAALGTSVDLLLNSGQAPRAIALLRTAHEAQPDNVGLIVALAAVQARDGDLTGAAETLDKAGTELSQTPQVMRARARVLLAQNRPREAADLYQQMLANTPADVTLRRQTIDLLLVSGQGEAAVEMARAGLTASPGNTALMQALTAAVYRTSGVDAAIATAGQLRNESINLPGARLLKGQIYMAAKRPADALLADAAESAAPPFGALMIARATALRESGKWDDAATLLSDWVAKRPDPAASDVLGAMAIEKGRFDEAEKDLQAVLLARPGDTMALNNLAYVYQHKQQPQKAAELARKAYLLSPSGQVADTLGWILTEQGQAEVGMLLLRQASAQLRGQPAVSYHYAAALKAAGQAKEAASILSVLLAKPVKFDERPQAEQLQKDLLATGLR
jgi:putative PEP-CTERM system TPR-repeat lipoprotein